MAIIAKVSEVIFRIKGDAKQLNSELASTEKTSSKATMSIKSMVTSLGLVKIASKGFDILKSSIGSAVERFDTLQKFPKVMESLGFNTEQSAKASKKLSDGIDGLPTSLQEVVASTQRMTSITGDLDKSTDATIALNNAFLASGASTDAASRGMDQYMKMVSTGKVELDSWTTLQETMPLALQKTAEAMGYTGKTAQNDLYKALQDGTVTFDQFQDKLIELGTGTGQLADLAKKNSLGIGTSFKNLQSAVTKGMGNVLTKFDEIVEKLTGKNIAQNFDSLKGVINATFKGIVAGMDLIVPAVEKISEVFAKPIETIKKFGSEVVDVIKYVITNFTDFGKHMEMTLQIKEILPQSAFDALNVGLRTVNQFIEGVKGIFSVLSGASSSYTDFAAAIGVDESETWMQPYYKFANKIKEFGSSLAEKVKPIFEGIGNTITNSVGSPMDFLKDRINDTIGTVKTVIETLSPAFSTVFGGIKDFISNFISSFSGATTGIGNNVGQIISFLGMFSGPFGMLGFLFKNFGSEIGNLFTTIANQLGPLLANLGTTVGSIAGTVMPMITQAIAAFMPVIGQVIQTVMSVISTVLPVVINLINQLLPIIQQVVSVIAQLWAALMPIIANLVSTLLPVIQNIIKAVMNIVTAVAPAVIAIIQTIITIIQAMLPVITSIISVVANVVGNIITFIGTVITVVANMIAVIMGIISPIIAFIAGIISTIFSVISPIIAFVSGVFSTVFSVISGVFNSVLGVVSGIWNTIGGIISGLSSVVSQVFNTISSTIGRIMNGVGKTISGIFEGIQNAWTGLTGFVGGVFDGIWASVQTLVDQVKGFVNVVIGGINGAIGLINKIPGVHIDNIPMLAKGGLVGSATNAIIGEAGDEAVIPLERPRTMRKIANAIVKTMPTQQATTTMAGTANTVEDNLVIDLYNVVEIDKRKISKEIAEPVRVEINKIDRMKNFKKGVRDI